MSEGMSDFDVTQASVGTCALCKLNMDNNFKTKTPFCKPCRNIKILIEVDKFTKNLLMPGLIWLLFSIFISSLRSFDIVVVIVTILPTFVVNSGLQVHFIYFRLPKDKVIVHMIKMYWVLRDNKYYYRALETTEKYKDEINESKKLRISKELVNSVLLHGKLNPSNFFENWPAALKMEPSDFVDYIIENTNVLDGVSAVGGTGLLPDIWPYIRDKVTKEEIMNLLAKSCENLDDLEEVEKHYFLEDMYLVEDDLKDIAKTNKKWNIIITTLDEFVPDEPPKPGVSGFLQTTQLQALEAQRQEKLLNSKNRTEE